MLLSGLLMIAPLVGAQSTPLESTTTKGFKFNDTDLISHRQDHGKIAPKVVIVSMVSSGSPARRSLPPIHFHYISEFGPTPLPMFHSNREISSSIRKQTSGTRIYRTLLWVMFSRTTSPFRGYPPYIRMFTAPKTARYASSRRASPRSTPPRR